MRTAELAEAAGVSLRQIDYWTRQGLLRAEGKAGSGNQRTYDETEAAVAKTAAELLRLGILAGPAVEYARLMVDEGTDAVEVDGWVISRVESDESSTDG